MVYMNGVLVNWSIRLFLRLRPACLTDYLYGTARANVFIRIDLFKNNRGTVRAFEINQSKR